MSLRTVITANAIRPLREAAADYQETEAIKALLSARRANESVFYLTPDEFKRIALWKLGQQLGRVNHLLIQNPPQLILDTTKLALSARIEDRDYEFRLRFAILTSLRGVGAGVASAILALSLPEKYCVIDYRGWFQIFQRHKTVFSFGDYKRYLRKVLNLASELGWSPQEVNLAIWEFDRRNRHRRIRRDVGRRR